MIILHARFFFQRRSLEIGERQFAIHDGKNMQNECVLFISNFSGMTQPKHASWRGPRQTQKTVQMFLISACGVHMCIRVACTCAYVNAYVAVVCAHMWKRVPWFVCACVWFVCVHLYRHAACMCAYVAVGVAGVCTRVAVA